MSTAKKLMLAFVAGCLMAPTAMALNVGDNYTIYDENSDATTRHGYAEDGEVEAPNAAWEGGNWDLEGFFLRGVGTNVTLSMVGQYDFINNTVYPSGDLFLATSQPFYGDLATGPLPANNGYDYVLDIDWADPNLAFTLWDIAGVVGATTNTAIFTPGSDPFQHVDQAGTYIGSGNLSYLANVATVGFNGVGYDGSTGNLVGGWHNVVQLDWDALVGQISSYSGGVPGSMYLHFTMGCGNDNLMGNADTNRTPPVPEPASMALLGMGILGVAMRRRFVA